MRNEKSQAFACCGKPSALQSAPYTRFLTDIPKMERQYSRQATETEENRHSHTYRKQEPNSRKDSQTLPFSVKKATVGEGKGQLLQGKRLPNLLGKVSCHVPQPFPTRPQRSANAPKMVYKAIIYPLRRASAAYFCKFSKHSPAKSRLPAQPSEGKILKTEHFRQPFSDSSEASFWQVSSFLSLEMQKTQIFA